MTPKKFCVAQIAKNILFFIAFSWTTQLQAGSLNDLYQELHKLNTILNTTNGQLAVASLDLSAKLGGIEQKAEIVTEVFAYQRLIPTVIVVITTSYVAYKVANNLWSRCSKCCQKCNKKKDVYSFI